MENIENSIVTTNAKQKMLLARAGARSLPKIVKMAFGKGGVDAAGNVIAPKEGQTSLTAELTRKDIDKYEIIGDTQIKYYCTLGEGELAGAEISEIALVDGDGDLVTIKSCSSKGKDSDFQMTFKINDTM